MIIEFSTYICADGGPKLLQEESFEVEDFDDFQDTHQEFKRTLDDQLDIFDYVGYISVNLISEYPKASIARSEQLLLLSTWKNKVADNNFYDEVNQEQEISNEGWI